MRPSKEKHIAIDRSMFLFFFYSPNHIFHVFIIVWFILLNTVPVSLELCEHHVESPQIYQWDEKWVHRVLLCVSATWINCSNKKQKALFAYHHTGYRRVRHQSVLLYFLKRRVQQRVKSLIIININSRHFNKWLSLNVCSVCHLQTL